MCASSQYSKKVLHLRRNTSIRVFSFYPVCVKSLRMNRLSVSCCPAPCPGWCARSSLGARPAESIFIMAQSWSRGWSATATTPRTTMKTSQNKSWQRLNVHLLCLNICRISLLTFLAGFSVVNPPSRIASQCGDS